MRPNYVQRYSVFGKRNDPENGTMVLYTEYTKLINIISSILEGIPPECLREVKEDGIVDPVQTLTLSVVHQTFEMNTLKERCQSLQDVLIEIESMSLPNDINGQCDLYAGTALFLKVVDMVEAVLLEDQPRAAENTNGN